MKKLFLIASLLLCSSPVFAQDTTTKTKKEYRPFRYETPCVVERGIQTYPDTCVVVETRESGGGLRTRNIYSNKHRLTIKMRWDEEKKKFMTWDSHNKFEYHWEYKIGGVHDLGAYTYVMPGFLVQNVSWD